MPGRKTRKFEWNSHACQTSWCLLPDVHICELLNFKLTGKSIPKWFCTIIYCNKFTGLQVCLVTCHIYMHRKPELEDKTLILWKATVILSTGLYFSLKVEILYWSEGSMTRQVLQAFLVSDPFYPVSSPLHW